MNFQLTTLVENVVYGKGLQGEHGLSLYIEAGEHKILFDTGRTDLFIRNARILGIDLKEVDYVVLSHGHNDHTGGLHHFLWLNSKAKIVCKKEAFETKFKNSTENGLPQPEQVDPTRIRWIEEKTELVPGVFLFPHIKITDKSDTHFENFYVLEDGEKVQDQFNDELALVLKTEKTFSIISACSHRGITNVIRTVQEDMPGLALQLVLGGFHIHRSDDEKFNVIAAYLGRKLPKRLGVCHCTGVEKYALFHHQFSDRVYYNYTGWIEKI